MEIPYFQQEDAGTYECVAENSKGRNSVQGKLSFFGKLLWKPWIFERLKPHVTFIEVKDMMQDSDQQRINLRPDVVL